MNGLTHLEEPDCSDFVEVDPTGRYGRYNEILGKGASKTVYRAFDEYEGTEVAWNQVKLYDFLQSPEDLERLYCEIHLLKTLKHKNIMKFYTSWVDAAKRNINFVTEMFTSGTLRQYRLKHRKVKIRAVKHWCRQILKGLLYLHSHDPPVIHRDLKCDNIFVNGNQGEVKIGDLGLAAVLRKSHAAHCVGTPEFMAPEVYEEAYNELVDIYSFGMCILEMVTFEYPYSECTHPAQIYKKVISGKKPDALYKVKDPEVRQFVEKCLATVSLRLSARELLSDPFLQIDDCGYDFRALNCGREMDDIFPITRQPFLQLNGSNNTFYNGYSNDYCIDNLNEWGYHHQVEIEPSGIELFECHDDEHLEDIDISIKGKMGEDGGIFLRLRIADKEGRIRNIYFPFDIEMDTALNVATEMVAELDIMEQDVTRIADMIDGEIALLVPEWRPGPGIEETPRFSNQSICQNCMSNRTSYDSLMEYLSKNPGNLEVFQCCRHGCASMHGRFEEILYQADESEHQVTEGGPNCLGQYSLVNSGQNHFEEEYDKTDWSIPNIDEKEKLVENKITPNAKSSVGNLSDSPAFSALFCDLSDKKEVEIQQETRWLRSKYQMELRNLRDQQLGLSERSSGCRNSINRTKNGVSLSSIPHALQSNNKVLSRSPARRVNKSCPNSVTQRIRNCEALESSIEEEMITANSFYNCSLLPNSLHRTISLPVDAAHI